MLAFNGSLLEGVKLPNPHLHTPLLSRTSQESDVGAASRLLRTMQ